MDFQKKIDVLNLSASIFTTIGAFFLIRSILAMSAKEIASSSKTYIGLNPFLLNSYVELKSDTFTGFLLTLIAGFLGASSNFLKVNINLDMTSIFFISMGVLCLFWVSSIVSSKIKNRESTRGRIASYSLHVKDYLEEFNIQMFDPAKLIQDAKDVDLKNLIEPHLSDFQNIAKILNIGREFKLAEQVIQLEKVQNLRK